MKLKFNQIVENLERLGLKFKTVTVFTEGKYSPEDAIWNYKDAIAHIPRIHHLVQNVPILNHKDSLASLFIQKIFGLSFPIVVYDYEAEPYTQTAVFTLFFYVLVVQNACAEVRPGITRVTTTYYIGASAPFHWLSPLVAWVLRRNYKILTATDIPLRERRGELRSWGYDFVISDYLTPENIQNCNIIYPRDLSRFLDTQIKIEDLLENKAFLWGDRSDQYGLKIIRSENKITLYPRMCPHEGASLDKADCARQSITCPWHGKVIKPLAIFDVVNKEAQECLTANHRLAYSDGILRLFSSAHVQERKKDQ